MLHFAAEFANVNTLSMLSQAPLRGLDLKTQNGVGLTAQQVAVGRRVAAEAAGLGLGDEWDQAFENLLEKVVSSSVETDEVEILQEDEEELFLDAQESIAST